MVYNGIFYCDCFFWEYEDNIVKYIYLWLDKKKYCNRKKLLNFISFGVYFKRKLICKEEFLLDEIIIN